MARGTGSQVTSVKALLLTWADCRAEAAHLQPGQGFYVSVHDGSDHGLLAGPFDRMGEAFGMVDAAQTAAERFDPVAPPFTYGVCRAPSREPALLNRHLGITVPTE